jgi:hypothetical protein
MAVRVIAVFAAAVVVCRRTPVMSRLSYMIMVACSFASFSP